MLIEKEIVKIEHVDWINDHIEIYTSGIKDQFLIKLFENEGDSKLSIYTFLQKTLKEKQELYFLRILPFIRQDSKLNKLKEKKAIKFVGDTCIRNFHVNQSQISFCILYKIKNIVEFKELEMEMDKVNSYLLCSLSGLANTLLKKIDSSVYHNVNESFNIVNTVKLLLLLELSQSILKIPKKDNKKVYYFTKYKSLSTSPTSYP